MRMMSREIDDAPAGMRVYDALRTRLGASDASVRRAKHVRGGILLDGEPVRVNVPVRAGQTVSLVIDSPYLAGSSTDIAPEDGAAPIVHADDDIIVVDKPAGLVMYPGPGHDGGTLANLLAGWLRAQGRRAGLHAAHRIDRGTSGLVVFALNSFAKDRLQDQLHTDAFAREYLAVCEGIPDPREGTVDVPLGLVSRRPNVYGVVAGGKRAVTRYRVAGQGAAVDDGRALSLLELRLGTGRTHQIRIHLAHIGHPLVGDAAYGTASGLIGHPALHSRRIRLRHPVTGESLAFEAPLPPDMRALL